MSNKNSGVRSERYVVRPFVGIEGIDDALADVRFVVNDEDQTARENSPANVTLSDTDLAAATVTLHLPTTEQIREAVAKTDVAFQDCIFVVLARGRTHRLSEVLWQGYLRTAEIPTVLTVDRAKTSLILEDRSGFDIVVSVVLAHKNTERPLRPSVPGTWLARRDLRLRPESTEAMFSPEPLTNPMRTEYKVPKNATSYIYMDDTLLDASPISDAVRVFVDEKVLNSLLQSPKDPLSELMQRDLAATTVLTLVHECLYRMGEGKPVTAQMIEAHEGVDNFFKRIATAMKVTVTDLVSRAYEGDMLRVHVADAFESLKYTNQALKGSDVE